MSESRRRGEGVYFGTWTLTESADSAPVEAIVAWCREVLATCRRPFGIDHFDLALAVRPEGGATDSRMYRLTPGDLYHETTSEQIAALIFGHRAQPALVAAALFSWGDAAHRALPSRFGA